MSGIGANLLLAGLLLSFMMDGAAGQTRSLPIYNVPADRFEESAPTRTRISSSSLIAGVSTQQDSSAVLMPTVYVAGIRDTDRSICVSIRHVSGSYRANFRIENPGLGQAIGLKLPSAILAGNPYPPHELSVSAQVTSRPICTYRDAYLVSSWDEQVADRTMQIYLTLELGSTARVRVPGKAARPCRPLSELGLTRTENFTSFTHYCHFDLTAPCKRETRIRVLVEPLRGSSYADRSKVIILRRFCPGGEMRQQ